MPAHRRGSRRPPVGSHAARPTTPGAPVRALALLTCVLIAAGCGGAAASGTTEQLVAIGAGLRGPDGLHAGVYAQGLEHASAFAVDSGNRLWVATAAYTDDGHDGVWLVPTRGAAPVEIVAGL